jgi:hypothetical protein
MIIFFFVIFLIAGIVHIFLGHFADGGLLFGLAAFLGFVAYFIGREVKERRAFLEWLKAKQSDIEKGWSYYRGLKITPQTEVTQYQACMSFIIITSRFRSRFLLVGRDPSFTRFTFTLVTFIFGWWGFPWGFIFTPQAIYRNLRGGYRQTISELFPKIDDELSGRKISQRLSTVLANAKAEARG